MDRDLGLVGVIGDGYALCIIRVGEGWLELVRDD